MDLLINTLIESTKLCADPLLMALVFVGVIWGVIAGALPGVGPTLAMGVALPFTFGMSPIYAIALLISINVADSYGNSIPAILIGVPGGSSTVLTAIDGYALHKQGKSGLALAVQYVAAIVGAFISIFFFLLLVVPLSSLTYVFLAPEMFALYFLGCTAVISITSENIVKGLLSAGFGIVAGMIGRDPVSSIQRYAFTPELRPGLEVTATVIGILAVSELFRQYRQSFDWGVGAAVFKEKWRFPPVKELWPLAPFIFMGTIVGTLIGSIPGLGGTTAAFVSYQQAKIWSKHPEEFGHGSIEGVAANEAAQNASQAGEMVPTFGLGIPGSSSMVLLFAALLMNGFFPGPMLIRQAPQLLYAAGTGLLASTIMLAIIGWPICGLLLKAVTFDRTMVLGAALALCMLGVFTINRSSFDVFIMLLFGVIGYFMMRYGYSVAGFSICLVLGGGLEGNLRRGLILCNDSLWTLLQRPWVAGILLISFGLIAYGTVSTIRLARMADAVRRRALADYQASLAEH